MGTGRAVGLLTEIHIEIWINRHAAIFHVAMNEEHLATLVLDVAPPDDTVPALRLRGRLHRVLDPIVHRRDQQVVASGALPDPVSLDLLPLGRRPLDLLVVDRGGLATATSAAQSLDS